MYQHLSDKISLIKTSEHANSTKLSIDSDNNNLKNIDITNVDNENWQSMKVTQLCYIH